jgi:inosine/xanthosine triphosphatase
VSLVLVASENPVKIAAAEIGFARIFPDKTFRFRGISVPSGVSVQPITRAETLQGAFNRATNALALLPDAAYCVGIEGGVEEIEGRFEVFAWIVVLHDGIVGRAQTGVFMLPDEVAQLIHAGKELGVADDIVFGRSNSKQGNGSIGLLTDDAITRTTYYTEAMIMALIPFKKPQFTWK